MKLNPMIVMRRNADGTGTFFEPDTGARINVNRTGRRIWEYLEAGGGKDGIAADLRQTCGERVPSDLDAEIAAFLQALTDKGYILYGGGESDHV